ncbi:MAG: N-6 DNA methylase [Opitutaceae bacterium]|nr:N-6 DNA methylase [Opitutaceae bacterium]
MVGQFFTPDAVATAVFRLARAKSGQRIIDPSCGDGVFLRNAPPDCDVFGCEIDPAYHALISGLVGARRMVGADALTALVDMWGSFDLVIGNPPFSAQAHLERRRQVLQGFDLGVGRRSQCLELLFLELFLKLAKPRGRIAIILPDGPFSNRPFDYVRSWLLRRVHVEAIVSLPRTTFSATSAKTSVLIAQKLPVENQPYREPTRLYECENLAALDRLGGDETSVPARSVVLADLSDWRPEAHGAAHRADGGEGIRLGDVFRLRTGFARYGEERKLHDQRPANGILLLRAKNVHPDGGFRVETDAAYIDRAGPMYRDDAVLQEGEVVFVRVGAGCYGRTALVPRGFRAQADDWIHVLTPTLEFDGPGFVAWMNSETGREQVRRLAKGVGTLSVSRSSLAELKIPRHFVGTNLMLSDGGSHSTRRSK